MPLRSSHPLTIRRGVMYDNCRDLSTRFAITSVSNSSFAIPLMNKNRLEAFSDGVLAIIITIMVLEMKVPHGSDSLADLKPILPVLVSYVLSFIYVGIYWNNHHHMLHAVGRVSGGVLWANLHLLFWLSLIPFGTAWVGTSHFAAAPTALYGFVLLMASLAYWLLQYALVRAQGPDSVLARAVARDVKGKISPFLYAAAVPLAYVSPWISEALFWLVALIWLIPDRRIERAIAESDSHRHVEPHRAAD
jgi:uncharacterized membrane protein